MVYIWKCNHCCGCDAAHKLKRCHFCHRGKIVRFNWPPKRTKVDFALNALGSFMFSGKLNDNSKLTWEQCEGWFIHKFKLRGKLREDFLRRSKEWAGTSLV